MKKIKDKIVFSKDDIGRGKRRVEKKLEEGKEVIVFSKDDIARNCHNYKILKLVSLRHNLFKTRLFYETQVNLELFFFLNVVNYHNSMGCKPRFVYISDDETDLTVGFVSRNIVY